MFIERFTRYLQFEKRFSPHTTIAYQNDLKQFQEFLNTNNLEFLSISHTDIRLWLSTLIDNNIGAKSVNRKLSTLRSYYKFLLREDLAKENPLTLVKAPKIPKRLPVVIEVEKLNHLLNSSEIFSETFEGARDSLVVELLFNTGIRLAELLSLKVSDINFYESTIRVIGKRNKQRIIPLSRSFVIVLKQYIGQKNNFFNNNVDALVVTNTGKSAYPKLIYRIVHNYLSLISSHDKKSPHILRHTFATSLLDSGADINAIKELLGHSSLAATQVYTHNSVERLKSIYKQAHPKA